MNITPTAIPDVLLIEQTSFSDERGFFMETWNAQRFAEHGLPTTFVQDNFSVSARGVLRGLHYQVRAAQGKLIQVTLGEIFDVAVDLRRDSPTFGHWVGTTLSEQNRQQLWIPPGFAHGFYVLSELAHLHYKCTAHYAPQHERSIRWNTARLGITWPIPVGTTPVLSARDAAAPDFDGAPLPESVSR